MLTSQDYEPISVVYVPEPIRAIFCIDRNAIGCYVFAQMKIIQIDYYYWKASLSYGDKSKHFIKVLRVHNIMI